MKLYQFQLNYLRGLPKRYIFAADTGTGKTIMALAHYERYAGGERAEVTLPDGSKALTWRLGALPLLILAPAAKIVTGDWQREVTAYFGVGNEPDYEVYSYEKFTRLPSMKRYRETGDQGPAKTWLAEHPNGFALIADEVHRAKNPQSGIGKRVFDVSQRATTFVGLSATPLPNGWIDVANYFKMFGYTKNITSFKSRYCEIVTYKGFPEIKGYHHEHELKTLWNAMSKPLSKAQALDLPPVVSVPVALPAGPDYTKVQKDRIFGDKFLDNAPALMHALRQSIVAPKVAWLDEFLEGASDNVVVFYNYVSEREAILAMIKKKHKGRQVFRQDGEKHEVPNKDSWEGLHRSITLAQYQSGSTGIELTYAATTVYFSPTYSYSNYEQSIGRINRHGQTQKMTLYLLCAPTTLEREVWDALRNKRDFQELQWFKEQKQFDNVRQA